MKLRILAFPILFLLSDICLAESSVAIGGLRVTKLGGKVNYEKHPVKVGDVLPSGGLVEVGSEPDAFVDLQFPEGHRIRLKKLAKLKISGNKSESPNVLDILFGQVFASFVKGRGAEKIQIKTPSAVIGVRGTKFSVQEDNLKGTYVCVCEGVVSVVGQNSHSKDGERTVTKGQDLWAKPGKPMGQPKLSPDMSNMTNKEFESMGL